MPEDLDLVAAMHPSSRPAEPDDPWQLHACELPGRPEVMLRMIVEEYARLGFDAQQLLALARHPFYAGLHGLWRYFGEERLEEEVRRILSRTGVMRVRDVQAPPCPAVVQIRLPQP
jgi:hypothetical protein